MTTIAYKLISVHYGSTVAKRSQVRLMNHIDEGLILLDSIYATRSAKDAYCIHPMVQNDVDLAKNFATVADSGISPYTVMLAMEYRSVANEYLSAKVNTGHSIRLSPIREVNDMLFADKVQNFKDFEIYHEATHARSKELRQYFNDWLCALGISESDYRTALRAIANGAE